MAFGDKLRQALEEAGKTQRELAEALDTTQQVVSTWVSRGVMPETRFVVEAARFLNASIDYLLRDDLTEPPSLLTDEDRAVLGFYRAIKANGASIIWSAPPSPDGKPIAAFSEPETAGRGARRRQR
jgi:transcriptional regulator with XRE-family HTH domain